MGLIGLFPQGNTSVSLVGGSARWVHMEKR
jgi:hypothetical protein